MAPRILDRLRAKIRAGRYLIPFHAANEMDDDELSIFDVESIILTGQIVDRQRDAETGEPKYVPGARPSPGKPPAASSKLGPRETSSSSRSGLTSTPARCGVCGRAGVRLRRGTRTFGRGQRLLVIERIPYIFCPHCGERYYTAATLREVERLKGERRVTDSQRVIPVVSFGAA